jgi:hypothetical protein
MAKWCGYTASVVPLPVCSDAFHLIIWVPFGFSPETVASSLLNPLCLKYESLCFSCIMTQFLLCPLSWFT